ncbi:MAG: 3-phosphoglycerate dehydrogenase family protein [Oscillospiraceae bacterium]|nr:3-phosphoglycerate dehydrogenase family protein [Oscillospiraceae bacterium]
MKIKTLNNVNFEYKGYDVSGTHDDPDGIIVRSASLHDTEFGPNLKAIARAGIGVNNIPVARCTERGIVVFNTPGANANAVKELVIAGLLLSSRKIIDGVNWVGTLTEDVAAQVEKGKKPFGGSEIMGKRLGVIGLGSIGGLVANAALGLGMDVVGYDQHMSVEAAWRVSNNVHKLDSLNELYATCDYITVHVPLCDDTRDMINAETLRMMKQGVKILNFARAEIVDEQAMLAALQQEKASCYVTDLPTDQTVGVPNVITIPHLGASTAESQENCATMASKQLVDYLENGNIVNSVSLPDCTLPRSGSARICVFHDNVPNVVSQLTSLIASNNANIVGMIGKSRGNISYTVIDIDGEANIQDILNIPEVRYARQV